MVSRFLRVFFVLACVLSAYSLSAQCSFNLDVTVVSNASCPSNGSIRVTLSGSEVNLSFVKINLKGSGGTNIDVTTNGWLFENLPAGSYTVTASTLCKGSGLQVSKTANTYINSSYTDLNAYIGSERKTLNCKYTGMIPIHIYEGSAPYKIKIVTKPGAYTGTTDFTQNTTGIFTLDNLPAGTYTFTVTDKCNYSIPLSATVITVASDFPSDPYTSHLQFALSSTTTCNRVSAMTNDDYGDLAYYWNENRDKYYDVAFTVNGSTRNWVTARQESQQDFEMPYTIKQLRDYGFSVDVHLRIKGCTSEKLNADNITISNPPSISYHFPRLTCTVFDVAFNSSSLICYPYSWQIFEFGNSTPIASANNIISRDPQVVQNLDYSKNYEIVITDKEGFQIKEPFSTGRELYNGWGQNTCPPDLFLSTLYFYWPGSPIPAGTRIRQLTGTTPAKHPDITFSRDAWSFYPFSTNYETSEYVQLDDDTYRFEVTNTCGDPPYIVEFNVVTHKKQPLSYTSQKHCDGLHVFPQGLVIYGSTPQETYYRLSSGPSGSAVGSVISSNSGSYFLFPKSGKYVIDMMIYSSGCAIESIEIDYEHDNFTLDAGAAYTCQTGTIPNFYIRAKNGVTPYLYELFENGVLVASNSVGDFTYGVATNSYSIRITDACGKNITTDLQVLDLTYDLIISGTEKVCLGDEIQLKCLTLGSTVFSWVGPNGFMANTQNVNRPNATLNDAGTYSLTLQPMGCFNPVTQHLNVDVYVPPKPLYTDLINLCVNGDNSLPDPTLEPDHSAVWFMSDGTTQISKPSVPTATAHEEIFYVAQKDDLLGCVGDMHKFTVRVNPLPENNFRASSDITCYNTSPTITIEGLNPLFTYNLYPDRSLANSLATITGVTSEVINLTDPIVQNTPYYIRVTDLLGCTSEPYEQIAEVLIINIMPDMIEPYQKDKDYTQQLETNAVQPIFTLTGGELPMGLWLNSHGLISGKVPTDKIGPQWFFTIQVEDENGCTGERDYAMDGEFFIPKVFTPNGDGINDIFMSGFRVVIFDRLGVTIFEGDNGWDGMRKGKQADSDIYFYKLFYTSVNGKKIEKTGYIGLER